jgi:hypothetical protein
MITQNLPTLKIHQLTDEQYKRVKESADYDPNALYITPDEEVDLSILEQAFDENGVIKQNALPEGYPYATSGEVLPMTNVSIDPDSWQGMIADKFSLIKDAEYEVIWNGAKYTCTGAEYYLDGSLLIYLGDLAYFEGGEPTDCPFLVTYITDEATAEATGAYGVVVSYEDLTDVNLSINGTIVYQIDKKFVPTPDVVTNIVNGDNIGSIRSRYAQLNDDEYQIGEYATALGFMTKASGSSSHAEGGETTASGYDSHAEGSNTVASGDDSHAEGGNTIASGYGSHAEGSNTTASGNYSHAAGYGTTALAYQYVIGHYNKTATNGSSSQTGSSGNTSGDAFMIGNGTSSSAKANTDVLFKIASTP